jgi:phosphatidylglycerophosphate synthase
MLKKKRKTVTYKDLLTPADFMSYSRIPIAIIMVVFYQNTAVFISLLVLAMITDVLDGKLARIRPVNWLGDFIDSVCDKIFFAIILVFLVIKAGLPVWQLLLLVMRDIFMVLFVAYVALHPKSRIIMHKIDANWPGKIATWGQFLALLWLFIGLDLFGIAVAIVVVLSLWTMISYVIALKKAISSS